MLVAGLAIISDPDRAPWAVFFALAGAAWPWLRAWRAAEGTTLRGSLVWAALALGLGLLAQCVAVNELVGSGRPWTSRVTYLMVLAILAGLISVLGARNPGGGAWAMLMVLLVVVFLIPWLAVSGRVRRGAGPGPLLLDSPWTLFYGLLVLAGVTNYLPTRYGWAAGALGGGLVLEYFGLTSSPLSGRTMAQCWAGVAWALALSALLAGRSAAGSLPRGDRLDRLWFWFRDHWGVVWALRVQDRFNRTAEVSGWSARLTWYGAASVVSAPSAKGDGTREELYGATLLGLLRRFAAPARLARVMTTDPADLAIRPGQRDDKDVPESKAPPES